MISNRSMKMSGEVAQLIVMIVGPNAVALRLLISPGRTSDKVKAGSHLESCYHAIKLVSYE